MNTNHSLSSPSAWVVALLACAASACSESHAGSAVPPAAVVATDRALAPWRAELLDLAFESASAMPLMPHVKNRSRAQEAVVAAALELEQTELALRYAARIENWRRGKCYADVAYHLARAGRTAHVQDHLDAAQAIADGGGLGRAPLPSDSIETPQEWRRDRIRASMARTYLALGHEAKAAAAAAGAVESETGPIEAEEARVAGADDFDARMDELAALVATGSFDPIRAALGAYAALYDRWYDDAERRARIADAVASGGTKLPPQVRVECWIELAGIALAHDDSPEALAVVGAAQALLVPSAGSAEQDVPLRARLATLRFRAGDLERARRDADDALAAYEVDRDGIVNIYRAGVLRPLAETYLALGDRERAAALYARVVEEGVENPNARPRAEDLAATAASMAVRGFEPDATLAARLRAVRAGLRDPW